MRTRSGKTESVSLLSPGLRARLNGAIRAVSYDIFTAWPLERVELVVVANLLNRVYFDEDKIACALSNVRDALADEGLLAIVENRALEQSTIFKLDGRRFKVENDIGAGCDIRDVVLRI
jgi:chemotaxis methyl-accepting protein methylase